jgi:hypothetical protein
MDIGLEVPVSQSPRDLERRERVLGRLAGPNPMGERDRFWLDEERVHGSRSRIPASPTTQKRTPPHTTRGKRVGLANERSFAGG